MHGKEVSINKTEKKTNIPVDGEFINTEACNTETWSRRWWSDSNSLNTLHI